MAFQQLDERSINYVQVFINTESGCDPQKDEYGLVLGSVLGGLDLSSIGGVDDISLIKEAIVENVDFSKLPEEGCTEVILSENGEWEDVFWHKYYIVDRIVYHEAV